MADPALKTDPDVTDYSDVNDEDETTRQAGPLSRGSRSSDEGLKFELWQHPTDKSLTFETRRCGAFEAKSSTLKQSRH